MKLVRVSQMTGIVPTAKAMSTVSWKGNKAGEALELASRPTTPSQEARLLAHKIVPGSKTYMQRAEECRWLAKSYLELAADYEQLARNAKKSAA
jgi:hypothetical protein